MLSFLPFYIARQEETVFLPESTFPSQKFILKKFIGKVDSGTVANSINLSVLPNMPFVLDISAFQQHQFFPSRPRLPIGKAATQSQPYCNRHQEMCSFQCLDNFVFELYDAGLTCGESVSFLQLCKEVLKCTEAFDKLQLIQTQTVDLITVIDILLTLGRPSCRHLCSVNFSIKYSLIQRGVVAKCESVFFVCRKSLVESSASQRKENQAVRNVKGLYLRL